MSDDGRRDDDGFLARWSRRKRAEPGRGGAAPVELARATQSDQGLPTAADTQANLPTTRDQEQQELEDEKARRDLPPVDKLDKDSDYAQFLKKGVPEALKRQALKRLWTSDPQFHVVDPFTEYGGDYTVVVPIDALKDTLYRPGIGYLTEEELEQQRNLGKDKEKAVAEGEAGDEQADAAATDGANAGTPGEQAVVAAADAPSPPATAADHEQTPDKAAEGSGEHAADEAAAEKDPDAGTAPGDRRDGAESGTPRR